MNSDMNRPDMNRPRYEPSGYEPSGYEPSGHQKKLSKIKPKEFNLAQEKENYNKT